MYVLSSQRRLMNGDLSKLWSTFSLARQAKADNMSTSTLSDVYVIFFPVFKSLTCGQFSSGNSSNKVCCLEMAMCSCTIQNVEFSATIAVASFSESTFSTAFSSLPWTDSGYTASLWSVESAWRVSVVVLKRVFFPLNTLPLMCFMHSSQVR